MAKQLNTTIYEGKSFAGPALWAHTSEVEKPEGFCLGHPIRAAGTRAGQRMRIKSKGPKQQTKKVR